MKCLILGGNGFIGAHLVDRLLERGDSVRVYDRSRSRLRETSQDVEYIEGELGNHGLIREAVQGIDIVYHFVCTTLPKTSNDDPIYDVRSNLVDTIQLLEACVEAGVKKVVFASSGGTVYGLPKTLPLTEDHPKDPITSYGIVKLTVEKYLKLFHYLHGLGYATLRLSNPYGPYQDPKRQQGAISVFLHRIYTGQPVTIWGDGSVTRDYLYISDLVDALERAGETDSQKQVLNIGSGQGASINELLHIMAEVVGEQPIVEYFPGRVMDVPENVLDISRAQAELGWSPRTELAEGIASMWEHIVTLPEEKSKW